MILCVDPDAASRASTTEALDAAGFDTRGCDSVEASREVLADGRDVVLQVRADLAEARFEVLEVALQGLDVVVEERHLIVEVALQCVDVVGQ